MTVFAPLLCAQGLAIVFAIFCVGVCFGLCASVQSIRDSQGKSNPSSYFWTGFAVSGAIFGGGAICAFLSGAAALGWIVIWGGFCYLATYFVGFKLSSHSSEQ